MSAPSRPLPDGPAVMRQKWKNLLFLHWKWDQARLQAALPDGLTVDTFEGDAWLGIVPFFMCGVRPALLPPVPFLSNFLELNVRTYVRDSAGNPGVWFFSLDCNQPVAVSVARTFFHLPYFHSKMSAVQRDGMTEYHSRRKGTVRGAIYKFRGNAPAAPASPGSLEEFLVERYRLYADAGGRLFSGEVRHPPYRISPATVTEWCAGPLHLAGFDAENRPPDHALHSAGVDVRVYPLRRPVSPADA